MFMYGNVSPFETEFMNPKGYRLPYIAYLLLMHIYYPQYPVVLLPYTYVDDLTKHTQFYILSCNKYD